jgi:hypothetical protein
MPDPIADLQVLANGAAAIVRALPEVCASIDQLEEKRKSRLLAIMQKAADFGPHKLPGEQFASEERLTIGDKRGTQVQVYAFKIFKYRVYACEKHHAGKRTFICTEVDESKKQDKADRSKLKRAATRFAPFAL